MKKNLNNSVLYLVLFFMFSTQLYSQDKINGEQPDNKEFLSSGKFIIGANYWASHAGPEMWADWRADIVEQDFKKLSENGIKVLRVFPNWKDFQPITLLREYRGTPREYRFGEDLLPDDQAGQAGVDIKAIQHFEEFTKLAEKYDIKLIVGLITGWMSGRLFVPPALEGKNVLTDHEAIMWEVRFVKYFVSRFKDDPAIIAWDLGNECNCMGDVDSQADAWNWISTITNAIKSEDKSRLVISGMHGLKTEGNWTIQDQAEVLDILTTHAYSSPTYDSDREPVNTIRTVMHPTANTVMWQDIGGKPCFLEETGTFGPMAAGPEETADYARNNLFTLWSHDCKGFLWWCAFNQGHLKSAPYDWNSRGSNYGLWFDDGSPKPVLNEMKSFNEFLSKFKYPSLPERIIDGVCILTKGQNTWATAWSSFILSKQAGLDIEYQYSDQPIKDSKLYFMPSIEGASVISRHRMEELLAKIREGATLYISVGGGFVRSFNEFTGLMVNTREKMAQTDILSIENKGEPKIELPLKGSYKMNVTPVAAKVLGTNQEGNPAFTVADYGKGKVYFLNYPMEKYLFDKVGVFDEKGAKPYYLIYKYIKESVPTKKVVGNSNPMVGLTEHIVDESTRVIVAINYEPFESKTELSLKTGWKVDECYYGDLPSSNKKTGKVLSSIGRNDAVVLSIKNKD